MDSKIYIYIELFMFDLELLIKFLIFKLEFFFTNSLMHRKLIKNILNFIIYNPKMQIN